MAAPTLSVVEEHTRLADETLREVEDLLRSLEDADLHRADPGGGWTGACRSAACPTRAT